MVIIKNTIEWLVSDLHTFRKHYLMCDLKEKNIFRKRLTKYQDRFQNQKEFIKWYLKIIGD